MSMGGASCDLRHVIRRIKLSSHTVQPALTVLRDVVFSEASARYHGICGVAVPSDLNSVGLFDKDGMMYKLKLSFIF
jgi:hypothetical protein